MLSFLLFCLALLDSTQAITCPPWSYDDSKLNGPSYWGDLCLEYFSCKSGTLQSPIDLVDPFTIEGSIDNLQYDYNPLSNVTLLSTRFTVEGTDLGNQNLLSFVGLNTYTLSEFHFHAPSEHTINGKQFDLEIHYLHADSEGNDAGLSLFFIGSSGGASTDWFMEMMSVVLPNVTNSNSTVEISLDITSQINTNEGYYHYEGSTTTPPCREGVQWFIAKEPIQVDPLILSRFTSVLNNSRPLQQINGRNVSAYIPTRKASRVLNILVIAGACLVSLIIIAGFTRYFRKLYLTKSSRNRREFVSLFDNNSHNDTL